MPCYEPDLRHSETNPMKDAERDYLSKKIAFLEAALCASLNEQFRKFEYKDIYTIKTDNEIRDLMLCDIDLNAAGISHQDLKEWWFEHLEKDRLRHLREEEEIRKMKALEKLSDDEKLLLGLQ